MGSAIPRYPFSCASLCFRRVVHFVGASRVCVSRALISTLGASLVRYTGGVVGLRDLLVNTNLISCHLTLVRRGGTISMFGNMTRVIYSRSYYSLLLYRGLTYRLRCGLDNL